MKAVEQRTEKIARELCLLRKQPEGLWELALAAAYQIHVHDPDRGDALCAAYDKRKANEPAKKKAKTK